MRSLDDRSDESAAVGGGENDHLITDNGSRQKRGMNVDTESESDSESDGEAARYFGDEVDMDKSLPPRPSHEEKSRSETLAFGNAAIGASGRGGRVEVLWDAVDAQRSSSRRNPVHRQVLRGSYGPPTASGSGSGSDSFQRRKVSRPSLGPDTFSAPSSRTAPISHARGDDDSWEVLTDGRASLDFGSRLPDYRPAPARLRDPLDDASRDFTVQPDTDADISETMRVRTWKSAENGGRPSASSSASSTLGRTDHAAGTSSSLGPRRSLNLKNLASTLSLRRKHGQAREVAVEYSVVAANLPKAAENVHAEAPAVFPKRHASTAASSYAGPSTIRPVKPMPSRSSSSVADPQSSPAKGSPDYRQLRPIVPFARELLSCGGEDSMDVIMDDSDQTITLPKSMVRPDTSSAGTTTDGHFSITSGAEQRFAEVTNVYPSLDPSENIPGAFPSIANAVDDAPFIFGSPAQKGVSADQFARAGGAVLEEMNAKLAGKGVQQIGKLPTEVDGAEGYQPELVYRAGGSTGSRSRFDAAHAKAFSKWVVVIVVQAHLLIRLCFRMSGIDSHYAARRTASGESSTTSLKRQASDDAAILLAKKRKGVDDTQTTAPLRAKSIAELRRAEPNPRRGVESPSKRLKKARSTVTRPTTTKSSALPTSRSASASSGSRLGFLASSASAVKNTITAIGRRLSAGPETLLKLDEATKSSGIEPKRASRGSIDNLRALLSRSRSEADIRHSVDEDEDGMERMIVPRIKERKSLDLSALQRSKAPARPARLATQPTFQQAPSVASAPKARPISTASYGSSARLSTLNVASGLPAPMPESIVGGSMSRNRMMRKSSRLVAPTPRASSSTLHAPTAASLARMQATVKPPTAPSLARVPSFARTNPLGPAMAVNANGPRAPSCNPNPFVFPAPAPMKPSTSASSLKPAANPSSRPLPRIPGPGISVDQPLPIASPFMAARPSAGTALTPNAARHVKYTPKLATPRRAVAGGGGGVNSPAKALKHKTSHATLAMAAKQQDILERRRMFQNQRMMNSVL